MIRAVQITGSGLLVGGQCEYNGFTMRETGGLTGTVIRIRNGSATGTILDTIALTANGSLTHHYGNEGIWASKGIYIEIVSGSVEGSIRTAAS